MGKQGRIRRKYHLSAAMGRKSSEGVDGDPANSEQMSIADKQSAGKLGFKMKPLFCGGVFNGLDIAITNLNTCLADDTQSVHSLAKTFKSVKRSLGGKSLKKDDKRKLRHDMFLSKIDTFYKHREVFKKNKNKVSPTDVTIKELDSALPAVDMLFHKSEKNGKLPRPVSTKQKGIMKEKQRRIHLEDTLAVFKKKIDEAKAKRRVLDRILEVLEQRVSGEVH